MGLSCSAATVITNFVPESFTWESNGSPYILQSDVYVPDSYRLDIGPGVEVLVSSTDALATGADPNRVELTIRGILMVHGTPEQPVTFRALSNNAAAVWFGIEADTCCAGTGFRLQNAKVFNAVYGVHFSYAREYYTHLDGVTLATNSVALQCDAGAAQISRGQIHANGSGVMFLGGGGWVSESLIHDNGGDGLYLVQTDTSPSASIAAVLLNNTIYRNGGAGIRISGRSSPYDDFNIANLIILSNSVGLVREPGSAAPLQIRSSDVFGNTNSNFVNVATCANCVSVDPRLDGNGFLRRDSPCIDAGSGNFNDGSLDPSIITDILRQPRTVDDPHTPNTGQSDSTGAMTDMGAYEYQPPLEIVSLRLVGPDAIVTFSTVPGKQYQLQSTQDFPGWSDVGTPVTGTGGLLSLTNVAGAGLPYRFYRVQLSAME